MKQAFRGDCVITLKRAGGRWLLSRRGFVTSHATAAAALEAVSDADVTGALRSLTERDCDPETAMISGHGMSDDELEAAVELYEERLRRHPWLRPGAVGSAAGDLARALAERNRSDRGRSDQSFRQNLTVRRDQSSVGELVFTTTCGGAL